MSSNASRKGPHPINLSAWKNNHSTKWWLVRESYLVSVSDPAELTIEDVFILDADFAIERPKRVYRQGLNLLHLGHSDDEGKKAGQWDVSNLDRPVKNMPEQEQDREEDGHHQHPRDGQTEEERTEAGTVVSHKSKSTISRIFTRSSKKPEEKSEHEKIKDHITEPNHGGHETNTQPISGRSSPENRTLGIYGNVEDADVKPMDPNLRPQKRTANIEGTAVDDVPDPHRHGQRFRQRFASSASSTASSDHPGTNIDPSIGQDPRKVGTGDSKDDDAKKNKKKTSKEVSQHTFYVTNTQRRVKFVAKNEVRFTFFCVTFYPHYLCGG